MKDIIVEIMWGVGKGDGKVVLPGIDTVKKNFYERCTSMWGDEELTNGVNHTDEEIRCMLAWTTKNVFPILMEA